MRAELDARQARAHRPHPAHARQQARRAQRGRRRQHLRGRRPATTRAPATRSATRSTRSSSRRWSSRSRSSRSRSSRRPRPTSRSSASALQKLATEDPSFRIHTDEETGQTIISGMGELHLEIIVDRLRREFKVECERRQARGRVPRGDRARRSSCEGKYAKQSGGHGQYGHVLIEIEPGERGAGFVFENDIVGGVIPKEFIPSIEKGVREAMERGVLAGYPVDRREGALSTTAATTTSTRRARPSRSRRRWRFQDGAKRAGSAPARAGHEDRSRRARAATWATSSAT